MTLFKKQICVFVSLLLCLSLAACTDGAEQSAPSGNDDGTAAPAGEDSGSAGPAPSGGMEITISTNAIEGTPGRSEVLYALMADFEQEHGVTFVNQAAGHDDYQVKIATQIATKDVSDIFQFKGGMLSDVVSNGLAMPLNPIFDEDPDWYNEYRDGVFNDFTRPDGQIYAFPVEFVFTSILVYNREIFEDLGLGEPAENWNDFLEQCDVLLENGYYPVGMGNKDGWPFESLAFSQFANSITGTEWFLDIKYKQGGAFTDDVFLEALDKVLELRDREVFNPDINTLDDTMANELYNQRKCAMMIDGTWVLQELIADSPQDIRDATEFTFLPKVEGGKGDRLDIAGGAGWGYGVNSSLEGQDEKLALVLDFMHRFNGSESAHASLTVGHFPGAKIDGFDPANYDPLVQRYFASIMDNYREPVQCYSVHLPTNLINVFYNGLQDFWAGNVTKEQYAEEIQTEYERSNM